ncbi:LCP family protein [Agrilactobacillus yilanensis]|uniref:LCP family protein n=1 Tax=Agrilactobacillus yilanensis TaxID=2485997 RepID=A0ABW4J3V5_9LACO|nr:LCP family protein [Agrilactobacillus yilanensis]
MKRHAKFKIGIGLILLLVMVSVGFGWGKYHRLKQAVTETYQPVAQTAEKTAAEKIAQKKPLALLLLGVDTGAFGRNYQGLTDTMMVLTLNPKQQTVTMTSIPRDTAVTVPGFAAKGLSKINAAYAYGQAKTSVKTVEKLLNIPVDYYVLINMGGLARVIDQVGGVDVMVALSFTYEGYVFTKGQNTHMTGNQALAYARMRHEDPQGDYGRQQRQQAILLALAQKSHSAKLWLNQDFITALTAQTQTDLTFNNLLRLLNAYPVTNAPVETLRLQGQNQRVGDQDMIFMTQTELQRGTDFIRTALALPSAKTGGINGQIKGD